MPVVDASTYFHVVVGLAELGLLVCCENLCMLLVYMRRRVGDVDC